MANEALVTVKSLLSQENIKIKFQEILHEKAAGFTANLAVMVNNNTALAKCEPLSVVSAAIISASLDLPLDPNLGFAYIIPYGDKAQFQIGYKGFTQLAMRSGQYKNIGVVEVYEGQLLSENPLKGEYEFDWTAKKSDTIIGYAAYFSLLNGFEKTEYWAVDKVKAHGQRFSQTYKKGYGLWKDDFDSMGRKTVLKRLLSKWGILSIEMQNAVKYDQSVINDPNNPDDITYVDVTEQKSFNEDEKIEAKKATVAEKVGAENKGGKLEF